MTASTASARTPSRPGARVRVFVVCPALADSDQLAPLRQANDLDAALASRNAVVPGIGETAGSRPAAGSAGPQVTFGEGDGAADHIRQTAGTAVGGPLEGRAVAPREQCGQQLRDGSGIAGIFQRVPAVVKQH